VKSSLIYNLLVPALFAIIIVGIGILVCYVVRKKYGYLLPDYFFNLKNNDIFKSNVNSHKMINLNGKCNGNPAGLNSNNNNNISLTGGNNNSYQLRRYSYQTNSNNLLNNIATTSPNNIITKNQTFNHNYGKYFHFF
jgi:hypothetical protein